jgi:phosphatidylglycerophosphate synthase
MPGWVNSDILTAVGVMGAVIVFVGYGLTNLDKNYLWLASLGFVINWFGDSLDGTLARFRHKERPRYGFFIDHTVDAINETLIFLGVGISPYFSFNILCLALISYLLMSILVYVRTCITGVFQLSYGGFGPTELRLIVIILNLLIYFIGSPTIQLSLGEITVFDLIAIGIAAILFGIYIGQTLKQAREMARSGE